MTETRREGLLARITKGVVTHIVIRAGVLPAVANENTPGMFPYKVGCWFASRRFPGSCDGWSISMVSTYDLREPYPIAKE